MVRRPSRSDGLLRPRGLCRLACWGVVVTKFQPRTRIGREVMDGLRGSGLPVFTAPIPLRVGAEDNVGDRLVTGDEGVDPDMGAAYADITREVLERVSVGV